MLRLSKRLVIVAVAAILASELSIGSYVQLDERFLKVSDSYILFKDAYKEILISNQCKCRSLCLEDPECHMFSLIPSVYDGFLCRLATRRPFGTTYMPFQGSYYAFTKEIEGAETIIGQDSNSLVHHVMGQNDVTINKAKELCNSVTGLRLGIYRHQDLFSKLKDLGSNYGDIWVNMEIRNEWPRGMWANNHWINETAVGANPNNSEFRFHPGNDAPLAVFYNKTAEKLMDIPESTNPEFRAICQSNPFGIN